MLADAGILSGNPVWDDHQLLVLAHTPGIPHEWLAAVLRLGIKRKKLLRDLIAGADGGFYQPLGQDNAASVVQGDGWKMLEALPEGYAGAVPLYSQLELAADPRTDLEMATALGVGRTRLRRWRVNPVFCPLTGVRVAARRGYDP